MNYQQTIEYLFSQLPMFSRLGAAAYKKDLHNTIALCEALGNPHYQFKSIHIAGTNGKGSTSHMLSAILQTAGYKTGLYTSPHLQDFRERIKVNGAMCSEEFVVRFTERIQPLITELQPSFFEITVAMAFSWFAEQQVDIAVIETGLGGRLDSTNIIQPELSIITNIGWDHMNLLGDTLEAIAGEKAGIIKPNTPVVIGEAGGSIEAVFTQQAKQQGAQLIFAQSIRQITHTAYQHQHLTVEVSKGDAKTTYLLDLNGIYQTQNLLTVLAATDVLQQNGWPLSDAYIKSALANVKSLTGLYGRWDIIQESPLVVLDVGHNEDGIKQIIRQLNHTSYQQLHIITGMVKDKDVDKVLTLLPKHAHYYFTKAQIPRALPENELLEKAVANGLTGKAYAEVNTALQAALQAANENDLILVCGSVFVVGEVDRSAIAR
jgi:dihydrofolate synthase/folylpolyglutamate synthase